MDALERIDLSMSQLDYIVKCWDTIIVGPEGETYGDHMANQFAIHYNYHQVKHTDRYQAFLDDEPTQEALKAYGLDPEKFWYLLLMAADYAENYGTEIIMNESASTQLDRVFSLVVENLQLHPHPALGLQFAHDPNMKLTLTVREKGKKRNTVVVIDSPNALGYLVHLIEKNKNSFDDSLESISLQEFLNTGIGGTFCDNPAEKICPTVKIACFTKILMAFLKPLKATPGISEARFSKDKYFLISECAYLIGLVDDPKFKNSTLYRHHLQDLIKDYMDISVLEHNLYYTFDFDYGIAHDE